MFTPQTCSDSSSATSSLASASGPWLCAAPAGPMTDLFGPVPVLANLSARQAKALGLMTSGTFGRTSSGSSLSAALQSSLENRLRAVTQTLGSTLYKMTWKAWDTGSGRFRFRLRASVPRTSATGSTGWPTPTAALAEKGVRTFEGGLIEAMRNHGPDLAAVACLTGWPTPMAGTPAQNGNNAAGNNDSSRKTVEVVAWHSAGWGTPAAAHQQGSTGGNQVTDLRDQAQLAAWPTPNAGTSQSLRGNGQDPERRKEQGHQVNLKDAVRFLIHDTPARLTASGQLLTGCSAGMASGGQLNPAHSRWLMGLPPEWDACAPMETRSTLSKRKSLSKRA